MKDSGRDEDERNEKGGDKIAMRGRCTCVTQRRPINVTNLQTVDLTASVLDDAFSDMLRHTMLLAAVLWTALLRAPLTPRRSIEADIDIIMGGICLAVIVSALR